GARHDGSTVSPHGYRGLTASAFSLPWRSANVVSNNAAAVIGTPVAISIANTLQLSPEPFVLAVLFGANMSYATPMAYQTNLLVMSAGNYKFWDFMRVGLPLILIMWLAYSWILPAFYYS
ncbi:MAG: anion permease, partial [Candidatus Thiodiazotropha sp. (ex Lucinoma borealis)]|nr:anion permease [Candidatus Thiodiazotropha sp. (ex Lucinoma borealis)]